MKNKSACFTAVDNGDSQILPIFAVSMIKKIRRDHFSKERRENIVAICVILQTVIAFTSLVILLCE